MIRWSALRNRPVFCEEKQLGFLQGISLDDSQNKVRALIVAGGLKGKCIILADRILSLKRDRIIVNHYEKYNRSNETLPFRFVRDSSGRLVGRVTDLFFFEKELSIAAIEVLRGYLPSERKGRTWVFAFQPCIDNADEAEIPSFF